MSFWRLYYHLVWATRNREPTFMNHSVSPESPFAWQEGYGALTVGERQRAIPERTISGQKQHHAQDTAIAWLERYADFDEGPTDPGLRPGVSVREAAIE